MGATRDVALIDLPIRGISINAATASNAVQLVASDSGVMFVNKYAGTTTYTLPACSEGEGKIFWFFAGIANNIIVLSPTATRLYGPATLGIRATLTGVVSGCGFVIGDGTYYYFFAIAGTWAVS